MKKFIPIIAVVLILIGAGYFLLSDDGEQKVKGKPFVFGEFDRGKNCSRLPMFLYKYNIKRPMIDLSQKRYTGVVFYYGKNFSKILHKKEWEKYEYLTTYTIDNKGNIYLIPTPFISIKPTTFNLQKAIYKMDSTTGNLTRWMVFDNIKPTQNNPYGLISISYDCNDNSLWAGAIDKSDYKRIRGRIYHINPKTKEILQKIDGFDALTLKILNSSKDKYLLAGSAKDNSLYAFIFRGNKLEDKAFKVLDLPNPNLRVRKIKVIDKNRLQIEAISFNYSLVAEANRKHRVVYIATYNLKTNTWLISPANILEK